MKIKILIDSPPPKSKEPERPSLEDRVEEALELIESDYESREEWNFLIKLNNKLCGEKKLKKRYQQLLEKIQPILYKYGQYDTSNRIETDAKSHPASTRVEDKLDENS